MFFKTGVLKYFATITGEHLCWSLFLRKLQGSRLAFSLKKTHQHRCFPVIIARFLKPALLWNTCSLYFSKILCDDGCQIIKGIFCHIKIRPRSRKYLTIDRSKFLVKRCFFSRPRFQFFFKDFFYYLIISLLQRFVRS